MVVTNNNTRCWKSKQLLLNISLVVSYAKNSSLPMKMFLSLMISFLVFKYITNHMFLVANSRISFNSISPALRRRGNLPNLSWDAMRKCEYLIQLLLYSVGFKFCQFPYPISSSIEAVFKNINFQKYSNFQLQATIKHSEVFLFLYRSKMPNNSWFALMLFLHILLNVPLCLWKNSTSLTRTRSFFLS